MAPLVQAVLANQEHPEYGVATIPFPIPNEEYDHCVELLSALEIGEPVHRDCQFMEISSSFPVLKRMEMLTVNLDELDYLAKRLDSFDVGEAAQFQAMAEKLDLRDMTDFINLTFCCQQATVITDFSDLEAIGRDHYMNLHGGCARTEELDALDGYETALLLIEGGGGTVTPYGVVYDNGMRLSSIYDGRHLPEFFYEDCAASVTLSVIGKPEQQETLYFPCAESKIARAVRRLGADRPEQCIAVLDTAELSDAVRSVFEREYPLNEHLAALNALTRHLRKFDGQAMENFHTVFDTVWPQTPEEILALAENLHEFTVVPDISTAEEYGRYMIQESGHFEVDPNLEDYINYQSYGERRIREEGGLFGDRGYVAYLGTAQEISEIVARNIPTEQMEQGPQMGGLS